MTRRLALTAAQARALHLAAQGLLRPPARRATREDVRRAVERMSLLQIDTIHVVARSPYLVLHSRLGDYDPSWLDDLVATGALFEVWAHEACIAPIEDWAIHRRVLETRRGWFLERARRTRRRHGRRMQAMLEHVRAHGPVRSADFAGARRGRTGWWDWKEEKRLLEALFALGDLMIARRESFQRVYDLASRVHPAGAGLPLPAAAAASRSLVERAVRALGVARARWIHDYFRTGARITAADLEPLLRDGTLVEVAVEGWPDVGLVHRENVALAERAAAGGLRATRTALLSPFDPVVWDRERVLATFGFDYRLECYTPAHRRRYGYFALPVLRRGAIVGRLDAKAHREAGRFEVRSLHLEPGVRVRTPLLDDLARAIAATARWHGTPEVEVRRTVPAALRRPLAARL